jgi:recombinational DNA repair protein RecR
MSGIEALDVLTEQFARLPGIGKKTAQRLAFSVLKYSPEEIEAFTAAITEAKAKIHRCPVCQTLTDRELCPVCRDESREENFCRFLRCIWVVKFKNKLFLFHCYLQLSY